MSDSENPVQVKDKPTGCIPACLRIFWMIGGALVMIMCFFAIAVNKAPLLSTILFWLVTLKMIVVRFIDIKWFEGQTSDGEPATMRHWIKYAISLSSFAVVAYAIARIVSHFKLL